MTPIINRTRKDHTKVDQALLIKRAIQLFSKQGYHSTTMEDIAQACNIEKSSLYHHISSRKELLSLVLQHATEHLKRNAFSHAYQDSLSKQERLSAIAKGFEDFIATNEQYCLCLNLVSENICESPDIMGFIQHYFQEYAAAITHILRETQSPEQAQANAEDILAQVHGAILLSRVHNDPAIFSRALNRLKNAV